MSEASSLIAFSAVNVATPSVLSDRGERVYSGISKRPLANDAVVWLSLHNLAGDGQADLSVHGGLDKAVYAYASEHLGWWADELGVVGVDSLGSAPFGENLSTIGVGEADVCIGDRWAWGDALLEVCQPRWPCSKLALYRGRADIQARFRASGFTGWYLRVLQPGEVRVDRPAEVTFRDPARLSILDAHTAMGDRHLDHPELVQRLAAHDRLAHEWRVPLQERLGRR